MRVAHVITSLGYGGAERLLVDLAPRLRHQGIDIKIISLSSHIPLASELREQGIDPVGLGFTGTVYSLGALKILARRLQQEIRSFAPNVVHSHLYMADLLSRACTDRKQHLMTTLHNSDAWWTQPWRLRSVLKTRVDGWSASWRSTWAIAVSSDVANAAERALRIAARRLQVIPNGIDTNRFAFTPRVLNGPPVILQVGRLYPQKGHDTALAAFKQLLISHSDARLVIAGEGPDELRLKSLARELGIEAQVDFLGRRTDIPELLRAAHVFWMPSRWEGFGIACLEAMAAGLPVVATRVGGLQELASHGVTRLIDVDDATALAGATCELLVDFNRTAADVERASALVRAQFGIDSTAERYARFYEHIVNAKANAC